ncbi:hypothetical protein B0H11DRAFT_1927314 [Mycena galericulata]|nr:hypothetical protein B0H11DRAFT_1927314 [Mycena galericulata]
MHIISSLLALLLHFSATTLTHWSTPTRHSGDLSVLPAPYPSTTSNFVFVGVVCSLSGWKCPQSILLSIHPVSSQLVYLIETAPDHDDTLLRFLKDIVMLPVLSFCHEFHPGGPTGFSQYNIMPTGFHEFQDVILGRLELHHLALKPSSSERQNTRYFVLSSETLHRAATASGHGDLFHHYPQLNAHLTSMNVGGIQAFAIDPSACLQLTMLKLYTMWDPPIRWRNVAANHLETLHLVNVNWQWTNTSLSFIRSPEKDFSTSKESSQILSDYCSKLGHPYFLFVFHRKKGGSIRLFLLAALGAHIYGDSSTSQEPSQIFSDYSPGPFHAGTSRLFVCLLFVLQKGSPLKYSQIIPLAPVPSWDIPTFCSSFLCSLENITANVSTQGANEKFPIPDIFEEFHIPRISDHLGHKCGLVLSELVQHTWSFTSEDL